MMTTIQIIAAAFGLFMAYMTFTNYKRKTFNRYQFVVWELLWLGFFLVTLLPDKFNFITEKLGISNAFNLFSIIAFVIILFLVFHNYILITKLEKKLEKRVREEALKQLPGKE